MASKKPAVPVRFTITAEATHREPKITINALGDTVEGWQVASNLKEERCETWGNRSDK